MKNLVSITLDDETVTFTPEIRNKTRMSILSTSS